MTGFREPHAGNWLDVPFLVVSSWHQGEEAGWSRFYSRSSLWQGQLPSGWIVPEMLESSNGRIL